MDNSTKIFLSKCSQLPRLFCVANDRINWVTKKCSLSEVFILNCLKAKGDLISRPNIMLIFLKICNRLSNCSEQSVLMFDKIYSLCGTFDEQTRNLHFIISK